MTLTLRQQICDADTEESWGQITCVVWLCSEMGAQGRVLCFGTGRGKVAIYHQDKDTASFFVVFLFA